MPPFNGSGIFSLPGASYPYVTGTVVDASDQNANEADLAAGLTGCITKDGQTSPTANIPMAGFSLANVGGMTLASGAVLNWNAGNYTVTHSAGVLALSGAATVGTTLAVTGATTLASVTATTLNKLAITAPAAGATLTIADGKTLTASNSLALAGADGTTQTFPAGSGTVARLNVANTFTESMIVTNDSVGFTYSDVYNNHNSASGAAVRLITDDAAGTGVAIGQFVKYRTGAFVISNTETDASGTLTLQSAGNASLLATAGQVVVTAGAAATITAATQLTLEGGGHVEVIDNTGGSYILADGKLTPGAGMRYAGKWTTVASPAAVSLNVSSTTNYPDGLYTIMLDDENTYVTLPLCRGVQSMVSYPTRGDGAGGHVYTRYAYYDGTNTIYGYDRDITVSSGAESLSAAQIGVIKRWD